MYFELCEAMGQEPVPEDTPLGPEDMPVEVQFAMELHALLPTRIAEFSGTYLGKSIGDLGFFFDLFEIANVEERKLYFNLILMIDRIESEAIREERKQREAVNEAKKRQR